MQEWRIDEIVTLNVCISIYGHRSDRLLYLRMLFYSTFKTYAVRLFHIKHIYLAHFRALHQINGNDWISFSMLYLWLQHNTVPQMLVLEKWIISGDYKLYCDEFSIKMSVCLFSYEFEIFIVLFVTDAHLKHQMLFNKSPSLTSTK